MSRIYRVYYSYMNSFEPSALLNDHWRFILGMGVLAGVLSVGVSLFWPLEYQAQSRVLITPVVSAQGEVFDQFTALKSAEQMGVTLGQVVKTTLFQNRVIHSRFQVEPEKFEQEPRKRRKEWAKKVKADIVPGSGVLVLSVFDVNPVRAEQLGNAVSETLQRSGVEYLPGRVDIQIVDPPIVSKFPVRPNLAFRALAGLVFGIIFSLMYVVAHGQVVSHEEFRLL